MGLIATVANRETFSHFGADRPSFLNTTTFKVTKDASGKPVLAIRSLESFTEPLIDFVVDLRWRNGQLIRQYSLLLDPAGYPAATQSAAALPVPSTQSALPAPVVTAAAAPSVRVAQSTSAASLPTTHLAPRNVVSDVGATDDTTATASTRTMTQIKVGPKATLRGIAWRIGARSNADLNQLMIAIYQANPSAFNGNINRLRLGATLRIPSAEEVAAISHADANRETHAQMQAWRDGSAHASMSAATANQSPVSTRPVAAPTAKMAPTSTPVSTTPASAAPVASVTAASAAAPVSAAADNVATAPSAAAALTKASDAPADKAALTTKILSLEGSLQEIQAQLEAQHNKLLSMQAQVSYAEQHPKAVATPATGSDTSGLLKAALAGMAVLAGVCVALFMRLRRRATTDALPSIEKVPAVAPIETAAPAPMARSKPAPVVVRAPLPSRIEVHEEPAEPPVEVRAAMPEVRVEEHEPSESALELSAADTSGINAAKLREELAAAKLREEIAAAWALPSAESYKREEQAGHESTLAQDIAKSLEDTMRLEAARAAGAQAEGGDTIEEEAFTDTISHTDTGTIVGVAGETASFAATEVLPESTMKMSASDFPNEIDPNHLDFNLMELEQPTDSEAADTINMKGDADRTAATDRIKLTGELRLANDEMKLGADDPKLGASSIEDELASWAKKSA